jgi:hypothetical protein
LLRIVVGHSQAQGNIDEKSSWDEVKGVVTDAADLHPLAGIEVALSCPGAATQVTVTDDTGSFEFQSKPRPGCNVMAMANLGKGYLTTRVQLSVTPSGSDVTVRMQKGAAVAGTLRQSDGTPVRNGKVCLQQERVARGRPTLDAYRIAFTDDDGRFRLGDLMDGTYTLYAVPRVKSFDEYRKVKAESDEPKLDNVLTYYGQTLSANDSVPITIENHNSLENLDIQLIKARTSCLFTTLSAPEGHKPDSWAGVVLWQSSPESQTRIAMGRFHSLARIRGCGIPPGLYVLEAFTETPEGEGLYGMRQVSITRPGSVEVPTLDLVRPSSINGEIVSESGSAFSRESTPRDLLSVDIELEPTDRIQTVAEQLRATVQSDGAFVVPRVIIGDQYWVNVTNVPKPLYVKRVEVLGRDAYGEPFPSGTGDLKITLGSDGVTLTGTVADGSEVIGGARVILLDRAASSAPAPNQLLTAQADANGRFQFECVAPHDYLMAAFADLPDDKAWSPEIINLVRKSKFSVTASKESQPISLTAIAAK